MGLPTPCHRNLVDRRRTDKCVAVDPCPSAGVLRLPFHIHLPRGRIISAARLELSLEINRDRVERYRNPRSQG